MQKAGQGRCRCSINICWSDGWKGRWKRVGSVEKKMDR